MIASTSMRPWPWSMARRVVVVVAVVVVAVAALRFVTGPASATGSPVGTKVDGFPIGEQVCAPTATPAPWPPCSEMLSLGRAALDRRLPGHAPVLNSGLYGWDVIHSETIDIAVFDLADGTRYAERVICGVGGCQQF